MVCSVPVGTEYEVDVAPLMLDQLLSFWLDCHWYDRVPYGAVALTVSVFELPTKTAPPTGCVLIVGASTETVTVAELESVYAVYPLSVFATRTL